MTEASQRILDEIKARLVKWGTDAGNVSGDKNDDVPPPLESDVSSASSDEGEDDSSDDDEDGQGAGAKRKADRFGKL